MSHHLALSPEQWVEQVQVLTGPEAAATQQRSLQYKLHSKHIDNTTGTLSTPHHHLRAVWHADWADQNDTAMLVHEGRILTSTVFRPGLPPAACVP